MRTNEIIEQRNEIARNALNGDSRYSYDAVGEDDGDINNMDGETGLPLVYRAENTSDVAVYSDSQRYILVCDANGPVAIRIL